MENKVRVGVIGYGLRGSNVMEVVLLKNEDIVITAVCDLYEDRVEAAKKLVLEKTGKEPFGSVDYMDVLRRDDVDAVYVVCSWDERIIF